MAKNICFPLFLALFFYLCATIFAQNNGGPQAVHISNVMPINSLAFHITCKVQGSVTISREIWPHEESGFEVKKNDVHYCVAKWGVAFADLHGFEPARDSGHSKIFWAVNRDGFFLSYDQISWAKKAVWQKE